MKDDKKVINQKTQTIGTTAEVVSEHVFNGQRVMLLLTNTSVAGEIISLGIRSEAKALQGIVLNQGDKFIMSKDSGYSPSNDLITALASVNTATLAVHEEIDPD